MRNTGAASFIILSMFAGICLAADPKAPINPEDYRETIKLACVGDSITAGFGTKDHATESYPAQLGRMLGAKWEVRNFGVSGSTLLNNGDKPYQKEGALKYALSFKPDVVVIMLGTNDTKPQNWRHKDKFTADYKDLIEQFAALGSPPRIFICHPVPVAKNGNFGIVETGIVAEIPLIDKVAKELSTGVIDMHTPLKGKPELLPDNVHPNAEGATVMAKTVYKALTGKDAEAAK